METFYTPKIPAVTRSEIHINLKTVLQTTNSSQLTTDQEAKVTNAVWREEAKVANAVWKEEERCIHCMRHKRTRVGMQENKGNTEPKGG